MGDLNNDKLNDIVTVSDDQKTFQPHFYNAENYKFYSSPQSTAVPTGYHITSIFIGKESTTQQNLFVTIQSDKETLIKIYSPAQDSTSYVEQVSIAPIKIQHDS